MWRSREPSRVARCVKSNSSVEISKTLLRQGLQMEI